MSAPKQHTLKSPDGKYNYLLFDSVFAFNAFVDDEIKNLSSENQLRWNFIEESTDSQIRSGSDWYGTLKPKSVQELDEHRTFLGMKLINKIQPQIKEKLTQYLEYLNEAVLPKPKMAYNDRGLGVFSFDRATMGMYQTFPVNTSSPMNTSVSQLHIELGNKQIRTSVKSVYAYFKDKQMSYPALQLYIMAGANAQVKGDDLLYVGLACAELVEFMELRGVSVEVNVLLGTSFDSQMILGCIRVKRFQDKLDKNQLLLMSSDPRYFRYRGFKSLVALSNYFGMTIPSGLGTIKASMGNNFVKAINPKGFVFEQSYSMDAAVKEVSQIIINYQNQLHGKK